MPVIVCGDFNEEPGNPTVTYWEQNFDIVHPYCIPECFTNLLD